MKHRKYSNGIDGLNQSVKQKLILLHGFGESPMDWEPIAQSLSNRFEVYALNLKPLFTSKQGLSFSDQVDLIASHINEIVNDHDKFHLVGTSYGGTLSKGLAILYTTQLFSHIMINPMPMDPLKHLKNPLLRLVLYLSKIPKLLPLFILTPWGKGAMTHLGKIFRMGLVGNRHIKNFNSRKLFFIKKALSRFMWISKNENWDEWFKKAIPTAVPRLIVAGSKDALFSPRCYKEICKKWKLEEPLFIQGGGHMIVKTHPNEIADIISLFIEPIQENKKWA